MFSWTTVDSIWLSGFGGIETTPVEASRDHPSFSTYADNSSPAQDVSTAQSRRRGSELTSKVKVAAQTLAAYPLERSFHPTHDDFPDRVLKADDLYGVVITQRLCLLRTVKRPERGEATLLEEVV